MANCCGGKNAGKRISVSRYMAGLCVFFGYHGTVATVLHAVAVPFPNFRKVRDFHREVFLTEGKEVIRREDINVNGRLDEAEPMDCEIPIASSEHTEDPHRTAQN